MNGYLLDTNILSELRKERRAHISVAEWIQGVPQEHLFTSVLVLGEIRKGIEKLRSSDQPQALALERWLRKTEDVFATRIFPITPQIADVWGQISSLRPLPVVDSLLAATAIVHDLTLVTRNTADLKGLGAKTLNPYLLS